LIVLEVWSFLTLRDGDFCAWIPEAKWIHSRVSPEEILEAQLSTGMDGYMWP